MNVEEGKVVIVGASVEASILGIIVVGPHLEVPVFGVPVSEGIIEGELFGADRVATVSYTHLTLPTICSV